MSAEDSSEKIMKNILINSMPKFLLIFVLSLVVCFSEAGAQAIHLSNLSGKVLRGSPTTYLDLFGKVFPGAKAAEYEGLTAERTVRLRQLYSEAEKAVYTGGVEASIRENLLIKTASEKYLLVLLEVSSANRPANSADEKSANEKSANEKPIDGEKTLPYPISVLALFRLAPKPEFLDAAEVPGNILNYLEATKLQKYFWLVGGHQNCLTEYDDYTLLKIENDRLRMIYGELPILITSTDCGTKLTQRPVISIAGAAAEPMINLTVVSSVKQFDDNCTGRLVRKYTRYFRYRLVWDDKQKEYTAREKADQALHHELVKFGLAFDDEDTTNEDKSN